MNLAEALQIEEITVDKESCNGKMHLSSFHAQPLGYLNGGATLAFAEITAGQASNLLLSPQQFAVGQTVSANHMKSMKAEGILYAKGTLLHKGKTSHVWCISMENESQQLISQVTVTNAIIDVDKK